MYQFAADTSVERHRSVRSGSKDLELARILVCSYQVGVQWDLQLRRPCTRIGNLEVATVRRPTQLGLIWRPPKAADDVVRVKLTDDRGRSRVASATKISEHHGLVKS